MTIHKLPISTTTLDPSKADVPHALRNYGNAAATSWLEDRYSIWRSPSSTKDRPRIQGYLTAGPYFVAWGNPVAHGDDYEATAEEFVHFVKAKGRKVVFMNIDANFEAIVSRGVGKKKWNTITCIRDDVLHPQQTELTRKDVKKNRMSAWRAGVRIDELKIKGPTFLPAQAIKDEIDAGLQRWLDGRKGTQIASSSMLPWVDSRNRRYFIAKNQKGSILGVTILAPIGQHNYQIKNSVVFPHAPKGTSEDLLGTVIEQMQDEKRCTLTFGTSAAEDILFRHFTSKLPTKMIARLYRKIIAKYHLAERGKFRSKFDLDAVPLFITYPVHGFGPLGVFHLMRALRT